jgi:hypothetical protein
MLGEHRLDLAKLDPEAVDLHLMIDAAEVLEVSVLSATGQVPGAVESRRGLSGEGIAHEAVRRQLRPVQIASGHAGSAHVHLARHADGDGLALRVEEAHVEIRDRDADHAPGARFHVGHRQRSVGHVDRRLRDAVHVHEPRLTVAVTREPRTQALQVERLPAEDHVTQSQLVRRGSGREIGLDEVPERQRRLVEDGHALAAQQLVERVWRSAHPIRDDHQPPTVEKGAPDLPDREVEGVGVEERPHIPGAEAKPGVGGVEQPRYVAVGDLAALRLPRRARRVDHVGQIRGAGPTREVALRPFPRIVDEHVDRGPGRQGVPERTLGDDDGDARVLHHERQAVLRIGGIEGQISAAGLEDPQDGHDEVQRALEAEAHECLGPHAHRSQSVGEPVRLPVQLLHMSTTRPRRRGLSRRASVRPGLRTARGDTVPRWGGAPRPAARDPAVPRRSGWEGSPPRCRRKRRPCPP